ncbi:MAG TPA: hypothetical protein VK763_07355 [Terriglobales bacterium]|nr:hypothetical protein [Terriglobales bacterium]
MSVSSPRIQFTNHKGKQILVVDFSHCTATEVAEVARAVPEVVTAQPRASVLILSDYTGASLDQEALRVLKESAVFDKPYVKKSAWIGTENFPQVFADDMKTFSRREFPAFKTRQDALEWLAAE